MPYHMVGDGRAPDVRANGLNSQYINPSLSIIIPTKCEAQNVLPLLERPEKVFVSREQEVIIADAVSTIEKAIKYFSFAIISAEHSRQRLNGPGMGVADDQHGDPPQLPGLLLQLLRKASSTRAKLTADSRDWPQKPLAHVLPSLSHFIVSKRLTAIHRTRFTEPRLALHTTFIYRDGCGQTLLLAKVHSPATGLSAAGERSYPT